MIFLYLVLITGLSMLGIRDLKKKGQKRDICVLIGSMVVVAAMGVIYLSDSFRPSLSSYILEFFHVKG